MTVVIPRRLLAFLGVLHDAAAYGQAYVEGQMHDVVVFSSLWPEQRAGQVLGAETPSRPVGR